MKAYNTWMLVRNNNVDNFEKVLRPLSQMAKREMGHWLSKFVVEVRMQEPVGEEYPAKSLLSLVMGIQAELNFTHDLGLAFLKDPEFNRFREILDAEMKRVTAKGIGTTTARADPILPEEEEKLWAKKLLGDFNGRVLLNTIIFLNGKNFALRSGREHRNLRYGRPQITLHEPAGGAPYLRYSEEVCKTQQGGLKHRKISKKDVVHHANLQNPSRCHVRLFRKYMSKCPKNKRDDAFYLQVLKKQHPDGLWYSRQPLGVHTIQKVVPEICRKAGLQGHFTNHSLRVTAATNLYRNNVDEQLIMERTGHRSVGGKESSQ
jgi:hypothetical protein